MEKFEPKFESLRAHDYPEWFVNAKFGIWSHWGPQSVPMYGDWYARNMYIQGTPQYLYHIRHYGHPSKFGYKDICALWKAENFDPDALMDRYVKAGARYFVAQAMHHDHFYNYDSAINPMNSVKVGPHKDICALWKAAADKYGLPFGLTEHLGASFAWWRVNKGCDAYGPYKGIPYDGNDPAYRDYYYDNYEHGSGQELSPWYTPNETFHKYWKDSMIELIDKFAPDFLYSDGSLPFNEQWLEDDLPYVLDERYREGLDVVAYLYNKSIECHGKNQAVYTQKCRYPDVYRVGVLDMECSVLEGASEYPWQTDTSIGDWFYDVRSVYKTPREIIDTLADIVSKNGNLLLNILQKPDGTIDDEAGYILDELGAWLRICGEAIYDTRPWKTNLEGPTRVSSATYADKSNILWTEADVRYTCKDNTVYAILMNAKAGQPMVLRSFNEGEEIRNVRLLGGGNVPFAHHFGVLTVQLPEKLPTEYENALAVELN